MSETNPLITNLKGRKEPGRLIVTFISGVKGEADIEYYSPSHHTPWQHSVKKYKGAIKVVPGMSVRYPIGVGKDTDWRIRVKVVVDEYTSEPVVIPEQETDPGGETEITPIIESLPNSGDWYVGVNGILKIGDKWRVYFQDRSDGNQVVYSESNDLENWFAPRPIGTTKNVAFVQHKGQIYAYGEDDDWMCIWRSDDGINHYSGRKKAFQWKLDTQFTLYFHQQNGEPRMFGRVRGTSEKGGWKEHKDIDRRGISYHKADRIDGNWESRILADPMDYFDYDDDLQPDFYQPGFRPDGTGEIVMYFRDKNNVITKPDGSTRITGPIYPVSAHYDSGMISIDSHDPAVDISSFVENTLIYDGLKIPHPGQVYIHPEKIEYEGQVWRVISRRSDEHYRKSDEDMSGIYVVKV